MREGEDGGGTGERGCFFHENKRLWGGRGFLSGSGETWHFKIAGKRQRGGCRVCLWLEVATGGESLRLVPGSAGSHIPPLPIVCGATLLCSRVYGGGGRERRAHAHTQTDLLYTVMYVLTQAQRRQGRGGEVGAGTGEARFILSGCSLSPTLEK